MWAKKINIMNKSMQWDEAILKVLKENKKVMRYDEIADVVANDGLRAAGDLGTTPAITVNSYLNSCDKLKGKVKKVGRGLYIFKDYYVADETQEELVKTISNENAGEDVSDALITAYGRFWDRAIFEKCDCKLYGRVCAKSPNASSVDFSHFKGIYLLHKGHEVVYVGQAVKLFSRLIDHTKDDKRNRWDSFSWFSITEHNDQVAALKDDSGIKTLKPLQESAILDTLEAMMIEVLGPERNKKVGNEFEAKEFEQLTREEYLEYKFK